MAGEGGRMVAATADSAAGAWHISVALCRESEYAAPALRGGLVEVRVTRGAVAAAILLTPASARRLADDLLRMADTVEAAARDAA